VLLTDVTVDRCTGTPVVAVSSAVTLTNATFSKNRAVGAFGGAVRAEAASVTLDDCEITDNTARHAGAVALSMGSELHSRGRNNVQRNVAQGGNGGAFVVLTGSKLAMDSSDDVRDNTATLGGGAAYWDGTTVEAHADLERATVWRNTAGYGPVSATGFTNISARHAGESEASRVALRNAIIVQALDYFGQVGRLGDQTMNVYLTTDGNSEFFGLASMAFPLHEPAVARWDPSTTTSYVVLEPNAAAVLVASLDADTVPAEHLFDANLGILESRFELQLRQCIPGETLASDGSRCVPCPAGMYWFLPHARGVAYLWGRAPREARRLDARRGTRVPF